MSVDFMRKARGAFGTMMATAAFVLMANAAYAAKVPVTADIAVSTLWTADNVYCPTGQIFVLPGATLTIEAGTVVSSTANLGGSIAVTRGAKINILGTADEPVIMTSSNDTLKAWHTGANEWGNITIMGRGLISASHAGAGDTPVVYAEDNDGIPGGAVTNHTNIATPNALNKKVMEGLVAEYTGDPNVLYGGSDDNDDSGTIQYVSLRYGGKVIGLNNELNGLSLGGIGRGTDIDHVDIMNNVDDGIEIWGGTVNLKYVSVWNIGDDSVDVDQGWRGKMQFGIIVQGYSAIAAQGSGAGDNCFETDGAENSYAQPVTTSTIYNFTVIGQPQPNSGDHATAWRDNARVQYRNCIFMDLGERLIGFDNVDGDGADGYGAAGTLDWPTTWTTAYTANSSINAGTGTIGQYNHPATMYTVQSSGTLAEMSDSVFYNNNDAAAYTEATARGVTGGFNNVVAGSMPISALIRDVTVITTGSKPFRNVIYINPMPANDALTSAASAPNDGFFTPAQYRGGFAPNQNWLIGWTAAYKYGYMAGNELPEVFVNNDISVSTTWTADNTYNLQRQIYVKPGATLTIEPGTFIQSQKNVGGSLAVTRGGKIYVNGTQEMPVVMTSSLDELDEWHTGANEWGNLTVMGRGLISASHAGAGDTPVAYAEDNDGIPGGPVTINTNLTTPHALNKKVMEGLVAAYTGDPNVLYGGGDDNDDSGGISFVALRYGGKVVGLNNELNGLSLGAIGRNTDIHHVDIMNNVDDGIEIWGGTVNINYANVWNIGDDSIDVDQGWRGKMQFGLIVQGYSAIAAQGSGAGDNCFETDGAENSYAQPVTTSTIYNFTVIGQPQPNSGDHATAWRDNARVQYRNCIFMDLGERLIGFDNVDGDGADGYGAAGTLDWPSTWTTAYTANSAINAGTGTIGQYNHPATIYTVQSSGTLAEMSDSVFYNNNDAAAYTEATARGVTSGFNNVVASSAPISALIRDATVITTGSKPFRNVIYINPIPANDAETSVASAPNDGFLQPAQYRGGFGPGYNWLESWTTAYAYGYTDVSMNHSTSVKRDLWKQLN